ncbi:hypothetical protein BXF40_20685 [Salmonella enterica subsp. enterica serovar Enteritidis]|nr:hypothetical protein [Salmonella enterica subsp. enterica serovar Enteritidis]
MLNKHPFLGVFLIFLGFKFLSMNILTKLGIDRPSGLTRVMDLASRHPEWDQYVSEVTDWLQPVVSDLMERLPENDTVDIT